VNVEIKMTIFEIDQQFRDWQRRVELNGGEVSPEDLQVFDELISTANDKIDAYSVIIKESVSEAEILRQEAEKLIERAKRKEKLADKLKTNLDYFMQAQGREKFSSLKAEISYRKSVSLQIQEDIKLAKKWYRVKTEIDKSAIKDFLKNGGKVKGCELVEKKNIQIN
jgi:hypothetical protein